MLPLSMHLFNLNLKNAHFFMGRGPVYKCFNIHEHLHFLTYIVQPLLLAMLPLFLDLLFHCIYFRTELRSY